jgi:signal peptidase II
MVKGFSIPFLKLHYEGMFHGQRIKVLGDFFQITFIENPGMAFGYDPGNSFKLYVSLFSLLASIALVIYLYIARNQSLSLRVSLAFILGGAAGNLIDRMFYGVFYGYAPLFYGRVVDFLDFDFFHFTIFGRTFERFPVFNLADASVTIGVLILIIFYRHHQKETDITVTDANTHLDQGSINLNQGTLNDEPDKGKEIPL